MFHVGGHKGSRGRSTGLSKSYGSMFDNHNWKAPLRCGIQFCTLSCVLFVAGVVLTCLGIHDVFGETVPITGPILLTVGALFLILASRQFFLAHKRKKLKASKKQDIEAPDGKKTLVVDADDGTGPSTILMDHTGISDKDGLHDGDDGKSAMLEDENHDLKPPTSPLLEPGTYVWPPLPYQPSPFTCVSMMLGKDPSLLYGLAHARQGFASAYSPGTASTSLSTSRPDNSLSPTSPTTDSTHAQQPDLSASPVSDHSPTNAITPGTVAVVAATSASDPPAKVEEKGLSSKIPHVPSSSGGLPAMIARDGINNFPNRTAIMMLRTLEIQETI